jgi:hypothetical protein
MRLKNWVITNLDTLQQEPRVSISQNLVVKVVALSGKQICNYHVNQEGDNTFVIVIYIAVFKINTFIKKPNQLWENTQIQL